MASNLILKPSGFRFDLEAEWLQILFRVSWVSANVQLSEGYSGGLVRVLSALMW